MNTDRKSAPTRGDQEKIGRAFAQPFVERTAGDLSGADGNSYDPHLWEDGRSARHRDHVLVGRRVR